MSLLAQLALLFIISIAVGIRATNLTHNPPELFSDELVNIVSARSVIETGKDLEGKLLPYFSDRVELRPPIYGYSAYLSTKLLGNNSFAIRLPAVFFGVATIILLFILTLEITNSHVAALFAAFCLAIIPWHIHYSRVGWEPASILPFLLTAIFLMIRGINKNSSWITLLGFGFFSLTIYTYQAAPLLAFLFLVMIVGFNYKYFLNYRKTLFYGLVIAGLLAFPYLWTAINEPHLHERGRRIFTFSQGLNSDTITIFIRNYVSHLSYQFLFLSGDPNLRHGAKTGVLYWWMLPFIILGLILLPKSVKKRWYTGLVALWFVVFPIAGTLTNDGVPHATRTLIGAPLFCLLCGIGLWKSTLLLQHKTNSKLLVGCMLLLIFLVASIFLTIFLRRYFVAYPNQSSVWWDYGNKEVFSKVRSIEHEYKRVCLGNVNYWNEIPLREYYLQDSSLHVINNTRSPTCRRSGSIIVAKAYEKSILREGNLIHIVYDLNKRPKYYIYTVD